LSAVAVVGPTAAGKSALALEVARRCQDVEVVSVDAFQVYRGMDIGTAKPTAADRARVRHHLLDVVEPVEEFSLARFAAAAREAMADIAARGRRALLVGGTGLYLRAVVDGLQPPGRFPAARSTLEAEPDTARLHARLARLDPDAADRIDPGNRRRVLRALEVTVGSGRRFSAYGPGLDAYPPTSVPQVGLRVSLDVLDRRIAERVTAMVAGGLLDEVRALRRRGMGATARQALGYRELLHHLEGGVGLEQAVEETVARTRRFARRQLRWFRRDPRIHWVDPEDDAVGAVVDRLGEWAPCA
jgi:tRNA dimethylallyltransferase